MPLRKETIQIQEQLGEYCRTGVEAKMPGLTPGRIHHYRRLVSNVVSDTLRTAFPITMAALGEEPWNLLVQDFFAEGIPQTPQVWKLPLEFCQYHAARETGKKTGLPFLDDLLYFEWMEIEIHTMPDRPCPDFTEEGDLFRDPLAFNPEYEILKLRYPVHTHPAAEALDMEGEYYALLYRMPDTGHVQFLALSALNVYLITRLDEEKVPLNFIKNEISLVSGIESSRCLDEALEVFLKDLLKRKLILGFIRN
ncbi:MAG: putative DNA-binding domain-containing protein [Bacteroidales bacterium]|nr:putative DNA-binding domain-containing protein [Bacteroidales bacterium]